MNFNVLRALKTSSFNTSNNLLSGVFRAGLFAGMAYIIYRLHCLEKQVNVRFNVSERNNMKAFDDLEAAVKAIDTETTSLGGRIDGIVEELKNAKGDEARVSALTKELTDVSTRLKVMAAPASGGDGGVVVPTPEDPVDEPALEAAGITIADRKASDKSAAGITLAD